MKKWERKKKRRNCSDDKEGGEREENKGTETGSADVMQNLL